MDRYEGSRLFATPPFDNYTVFFVPYCSGDSWTGDADAPDNTTGRPVWYRGRRLLAALHDALAPELAAASEVLYAGCSAGALTTYLHVDAFAAALPAAVRVRGLGDAMYDLDTANPAPVVPWSHGTFPEQMKAGLALWNGTFGLPPACRGHFGTEDAWRCLFGANVMPFVQTPTFVLNSKYDTFQGGALIGANTSIAGSPPPIREYWVGYGKRMAASISALGPQHGAFVSNCQQHCQTGYAGATGHAPPGAWFATTVDGVTMADAFVGWYAGTAVRTRRVQDCDVYPCPGDVCG